MTGPDPAGDQKAKTEQAKTEQAQANQPKPAMSEPDSRPCALDAAQLTMQLTSADLPFNTLTELPETSDFLGQRRAKKALEFGLAATRNGYNLFVMGESGTGRLSMVMKYLTEKAKLGGAQPDWVYVNNFDESREPWVIQLPAGHGKKLVDDCQQMVRRLMIIIPAAFENPSYQRKAKAIDKRFNQLFEAAVDSLEKEANELNFALYQDATTITFSPIIDGKPVDDIAFAGLGSEQREQIGKIVDELEDKLTEKLLEMPQWKRESYEKLQELNSKTIEMAITPLVAELTEKYKGLTGPQIYLKELRGHLVKKVLENFELFDFLEQGNDLSLRDLLQQNFVPNLLVANRPDSGKPVVYEAHPSFTNLFGRIEYWNESGTITTSFQHIQNGALHRANGGYLVLEAEKLFEDPYLWGQLKRALQTEELRYDPPISETQTAVTMGLNPHGVPLNVKIILVGSREYYYLLQDHDPEFCQLFRVLVDFDEQLDLSVEVLKQMAQLLKSHAQQEGFSAITNQAVIELVKFSARLCGDQRKLSMQFGEIFELLGEANVLRIREGDKEIDGSHIIEALEGREYRHSRIRNEMLREVLDGQILINTEGHVVGCINGLTVWEIGSTHFGTPARITATVFPGSKGIVDIERESELGLSIHSKGVLILSGYLANRYAREFPLTLSANIVMEQSYGFIDGDSASLAELCALLSAITERSIKQSLSVTGSINQFGEVQAIGGVNEKIEGFFGVCDARGLDGSQGVIIPKANQHNLMLKTQVVEAVQKGLFNIYTVETVEQAVKLLCSLDDAEVDDFHHKVMARLKDLYDICEPSDEDDEENVLVETKPETKATGLKAS